MNKTFLIIIIGIVIAAACATAFVLSTNNLTPSATTPYKGSDISLTSDIS